MASHQLAIAKAALSAALLRPDPISVSRDEITTFHSLLEAALTRCSQTNVQLCKRWLLGNITPSTARLKSLGKYLVALSLSFEDIKKESGSLMTEKKPSARRKRLHVLYILNDLFHHVRRDGQNGSDEELVASNLQPFLVQLLGAAASFKKCPRHQEKVQVLLSVWEEKCYFNEQFIEGLREAAEGAKKAGGAVTSQDGVPVTEPTKLERKSMASADAPFVMPASHGDPSTPYYDLPAGNLMPHISPDGNHPINPQLVKPLQLVPGPADGELVAAVKMFLQDVDRLFGGQRGGEDGVFADIDELGQPLLRDEGDREVTGGDSYYGWSRSFCEKMKARKRRRGADGENQGRSNSRARSITPRKRRRYSDSRSSSRGRQRSPSYPSSRSPSRFERLEQRRNAHNRRSRSKSRSRFRSASPLDRARQRERGRSRTRSPVGSRSPPYSPKDGTPSVQQPAQNGTPFSSQYPGSFHAPAAPLPGHPMPDPALLAQIMAQASRMLPGGVPMPPPPLLPNGQWLQHPPPPPPPQAFLSHGTFNTYPPHPSMPIPPPPPPPPPSGPPPQQSFGHTSQTSSHSAGQWR